MDEADFISEFPDVHEQPLAPNAPDYQALSHDAAERVSSRRADRPALAELASSSDPVAHAVEAASQGATIGQLAQALGFGEPPIQIPPLEARSFAEPFEALRDASDAWQATHGTRPTVFLANLGPVSHHTARATYARWQH